MRLKSPHRPGGEAGQPGRSRSRLATLLAVGALTLGMTSYAAVFAAGPASADPVCQEVAVGSDTIQDVMNQYALDLGGSLLCSYNATDPVTGAIGSSGGTVEISYEKGFNPTEPTGPSCASYERPDGSSQGQSALRQSINPTTTAPSPMVPAPGAGCIDIGRDSSPPSVVSNGYLTYIPFAEDTVTGAVGPNTGGTVQGIFGPVTTVPTMISPANADQFTVAQLSSMYGSCDEVTIGSTTYWPYQTGVTQPSGTQRIDLYLPQAGSGTLKFWEGTTGLNFTQNNACDFQTIQFGAYAGTTPPTQVEEHDGLAVATDQYGYMPFSVAQWISQSVHTTGDPVDIDRRYGAQLVDVNSVAPTTGTAPNLKLNTTFPLNREVYNIVEGCRVDSTDPNVPSVTINGVTQTCTVDDGLVSMLVGQGGSLCQDVLTILNYGFATLGGSNTTEPNTCGQDNSALYAFPVTAP
jgi:hypothetical protein